MRRHNQSICYKFDLKIILYYSLIIILAIETTFKKNLFISASLWSELENFSFLSLYLKFNTKCHCTKNEKVWIKEIEKQKQNRLTSTFLVYFPFIVVIACPNLDLY